MDPLIIVLGALGAGFLSGFWVRDRDERRRRGFPPRPGHW